MRKLASIRRIMSISPIPNADAIECAQIDGWSVVVKKGEFKPGELVVYFEIDSWIPHELAPFLSKGKEPREFEGVKGERLRTIKLRGQLSQGLILPISILLWVCDFQELMEASEEGADVTELLNINKWEKPIPPSLAGQIKGNFPTQIPKTDQERVQNIHKQLQQWKDEGIYFEVTEKLEGSSMTCYVIDGVFGVCSRNLDLKRDENNTFWKTAIAQNIEQDLINLSQVEPYKNIAIQGELVGPGIQGNIYNLSEHKFYLFDVYLIDQGRYATCTERLLIWDKLSKVDHVPADLIQEVMLDTFDNFNALPTYAEGSSQLNPKQEREGLVFKSLCGKHSFKAISNKYLLSEK